MSSDDPLNHLGRDVRILAALIDAWIAGLYAGAIYDWRVRAALESAIQRESTPKATVSTERDRRAMKSWGAVDQEGIYLAACLSEREAEVARWHFDLGMTALDMSRYFGGDPIRLGAILHRVREKLAALGRTTEL